MDNNILLTGCTGFSGSWLAERIIDDKLGTLYGTVRGRCRQTTFIDHIKNHINLLECDLTDFNSVYSTLKESNPDYIFHLAAQSFVPTSWRAPQETINTNVLGTLNILEAVRKLEIDPKILITSSSEVYGYVNEDELPIKETNPLRPLSPYATSKCCQDLLGYQYWRSYGIKVIRTRAFNIMGPRSGEKIVTASIAKQIAEKEQNRFIDNINVGNLEAIRDFNDVRDITRAYVMCLYRATVGEVYNISTGVGHTIKDILNTFGKYTTIDLSTKQENNRMRPSDVSVLIGDSLKLRNEIGWKPSVEFENSIKDILEYWRTQI